MAQAISARARRFTQRLRGEETPAFRQIMAGRRVAASAGEDNRTFALTLALLHAKNALDREMRGARLQELANALGEDLLDAVREATPCNDALDPDGHDQLPPVSTLARRGAALIEQVGKDPAITEIADCAAQLIARDETAEEAAA